MIGYLKLSIPVFAIAAVGAGLTGCDEGSVATDDPSAAPELQAATTDCVEFHGLQHCRLGNAQLSPSADGSVLEVGRLVKPDSDGVSVLLPAVTNFAPEGRIDANAIGSTVNVRAFGDGKILGTLAMTRNENGYVLSAGFTGDGNTGTYNVNLYNHDVRVATIVGLRNGSTVLLPYWRPYWWYWHCWCWWWWWPHFWNVVATGSCVWSVPFPEGQEVQARDDRGNLVAADRVELEEVVKGAGSYPYLTFNRIDYTTGAGWMQLGGENIGNRQ
jgi:hypothetical protein